MLTQKTKDAVRPKQSRDPNLDLRRLPGKGTAVLRRISALSFGFYLCSDLSDDLVYSWFNQLPISFTVKYLCMPLAVLASFALAAALSQVIAWVQAALFRLAGNLKRKKEPVSFL